MKGAILKNELKNDRCANAKDCYYKLNRDLIKDRSEESNQNWIKWEVTEDERIVQNTPLSTNCTFIGLGIEKRLEYNTLKASGEEHIIFTDRENIPDTKTVVGTQNFYQVQGDINPVLDGKWNHVSSL